MESYLKEQGVVASSIKVYCHFYNSTIKFCFGGIEPENMLASETVEKLLNYVDGLDKTTNVKIGHLVAWRKICELKKIDGDMKPILNKLKQLNEKQLYVAATKQETDNKISIGYLTKLREEYKERLREEFTTNDMYYLFCSLYTYMLPLRSEDYYNTLIHDSDDDGVDVVNDNYYDVEKKQLVLNKYKTSKVHGTRMIDFPEVLHDIIMEFHRKSQSKYLICSTKKGKFSSVSFNITLKRCLKKEASSSMLRKCFISDKMDAGMTAEDRISAAKTMGHTASCQMLTYSKFSDVLHPDNDNLAYWTRRSEQLTQQLKEAHDNIRRLL